jgi:coenzyme F420-reducing hydrogenase alpha subunit
MTTKTINVSYLARVEGEGSFRVKIKNGKVTSGRLEFFEPPRFFEALLLGRHYTEAPDITARICGICPVAYQMSSIHAMEMACGVEITGQLRELRRLLYCGEWIESHALHIYMLHGPDFLGYPDAIALARDYPDVVQRGLRLKKVGNQIMTVLGGREIHPINVRVGGFYRVPTRRELEPLMERLRWAREAAMETVRWVGTLPFPDFTQDYDFVALRHPTEYPLNEGRIVSSSGIDIAVTEYEEVFEEQHVRHSTALHSVIRSAVQTYFVGPLARYSINFDRLSPLAQQAARDAGLEPTCRNPFQSIIVRAVEVLYACDEALRILEHYEQPDQPAMPVPPRPGQGYACTEAPRGVLYHHYTIDADGTILGAKIVPPTSQNQKTIEGDLIRVVSGNIDKPKAELTALCEQAIRNYDPCISCSTHFLTLDVERE